VKFAARGNTGSGQNCPDCAATWRPIPVLNDPARLLRRAETLRRTGGFVIFRPTVTGECAENSRTVLNGTNLAVLSLSTLRIGDEAIAIQSRKIKKEQGATSGEEWWSYAGSALSDSLVPESMRSTMKTNPGKSTTPYGRISKNAHRERGDIPGQASLLGAF